MTRMSNFCIKKTITMSQILWLRHCERVMTSLLPIGSICYSSDHVINKSIRVEIESLKCCFFHINWFWSRYHVAICRNLQYDVSVIHIVGCVKVRCCGFIKHPEIEIVNINDEYYVNNDNFQERIKDLKYFNHYCYSKSRFLLFFLLVCYIGFLCNV